MGVTADVLRLLRGDRWVGVKLQGIPLHKGPSQLTYDERISFYDAYLSQYNVGFHHAGGFEALHRIGDPQIAAAVADMLVRLGGTGTIAETIQETVVSTLEAFPGLRNAVPGMDVDGRLGSITVEALRVIAAEPSARRTFLDDLADARTQYMDTNRKPGWGEFVNGVWQIFPGDLARVDHFRYRSGRQL